MDTATNVWKYADIEVENLLSKGQYDRVLEYVEDNRDNLAEGLEDEDYQRVRSSALYGRTILDYFEEGIKDQTEKNAYYQLGTLAGFIDASSRVAYDHFQEEKAEAESIPQVYSVKHLDEIMLALDLYGYLNQKQLCEKLGMHDNTLSSTLKKAMPTQLLEVSRMGKCKYYRLSDAGTEAVVQLKKRNAIMQKTAEEEEHDREENGREENDREENGRDEHDREMLLEMARYLGMNTDSGDITLERVFEAMKSRDQEKEKVFQQ